MLQQTISEKILSRKAGRMVRAGEYILADVDGAMASDTTAPQMIQSFRSMGGTRVWNPSSLSLVLDHASPAPNERIAALHQMIRQFGKDVGAHFYEGGRGICHHLMLENNHVAEGDVFLGADSHTCTYGAIGAFATGVGSTDLAGVLLTGKTWLKVPESIRINLDGELPYGSSAKDIVLHVLRKLGPSKACYRAVEYGGSYIEKSSLADRIPLANMGSEMGAKVAITEQYNSESIKPDLGAEYVETLEFDVSTIEPQVSLPGAPHMAENISKIEGTKIDVAFIGSCTNTRIEDLRQAAHILKGNRVASGVRLMVVPASSQTLKEAIDDGTLSILIEAGATLLPSGCGPCVGTHLGVPGNSEVVISAANRNFKGRMGNPNAEVYLGSPATVAASAVTGVITNPATMLR